MDPLSLESQIRFKPFIPPSSVWLLRTLCRLIWCSIPPAYPKPMVWEVETCLQRLLLDVTPTCCRRQPPFNFRWRHHLHRKKTSFPRAHWLFVLIEMVRTSTCCGSRSPCVLIQRYVGQAAFSFAVGRIASCPSTVTRSAALYFFDTPLDAWLLFRELSSVLRLFNVGRVGRVSTTGAAATTRRVSNSPKSLRLDDHYQRRRIQSLSSLDRIAGTRVQDTLRAWKHKHFPVSQNATTRVKPPQKGFENHQTITLHGHGEPRDRGDTSLSRPLPARYGSRQCSPPRKS